MLLESNLDFLCLSETWLHDNSSTAALIVPGYVIFRRDRTDAKGSGVMIYVRDTIHCKEIQWQNPNNLECVGLNVILLPQMSYILIVIYRPPSSNISFYDKFKKLLCQCDFRKYIIVMGDLNINWEDKSSRKKIKLITDGFNLVQMVKGPTRIIHRISTQIDLIFSNRAERITKSHNTITRLPGHYMVLVSRKLTHWRFTTQVGNKKFFGIPKNKQEDFKAAIRKINWDNLLLENDLEKNSKKLYWKIKIYN